MTKLVDRNTTIPEIAVVQATILSLLMGFETADGVMTNLTERNTTITECVGQVIEDTLDATTWSQLAKRRCWLYCPSTARDTRRDV